MVPVFLLMGAHHAREWPRSEHTIEFGYDLLESYADGEARARRILDSTRLVIVPVVNVDGFKISRNAAPNGNVSLFDYEMKRKNCTMSEDTPAFHATGTCEDNQAGCGAPTRTATTPASGAAEAPAPTGPVTPSAVSTTASPRSTRCAPASPTARSP